MSFILQPGDLVATDTGGNAKVIRKLGEGGQGAVYLVDCGGKNYALKWYRPGAVRDVKEFRDNLEKNIMEEAPSKKFVWPKFLTEYKGGTFGYIMDVFPSDYTSFEKILVKPAENRFSGLEATLNAALNIINAYRDLHQVGKSYQDLNEGGFVIRLSDGDVLICDCDNVADDKVNLGIAGKPGYMAPEIVAGGGTVKPSIRTDNYSLANVLFRLLMRGDPLAGALHIKRPVLTEAAEREFYGENPVFVFDPENDTNRPVNGVHNNVIRSWPTYPKFIQQAFTDAFTKGLKDPYERITENAWQKLFVRLKGELIQCLNPKCGIKGFAEIFKTPDALVCPACKHSHPMPKEIAPNGFQVLLFPGVKLFKGHTNSRSNYLTGDDYLIQTGAVIQNPKDPNRWGLRNMSTDVWAVKDANGRRELEPGKVLGLVGGLEITFPNGSVVNI